VLISGSNEDVIACRVVSGRGCGVGCRDRKAPLDMGHDGSLGLLLPSATGPPLTLPLTRSLVNIVNIHP
jgi:hypothetical protein